MADNADKDGLEKTMIALIEAQGNGGMVQTDMLLMLSLVNLMGIVNVLQHSTGLSPGVGSVVTSQKVPVPDQSKDNNDASQEDLMQLLNQATTGQLDPMQLLTMLNGSGGGLPNPAALMGILSQMMPPATEQSPATGTESPPATESEREQREYPKNYLKWDPRLG